MKKIKFCFLTLIYLSVINLAQANNITESRVPGGIAIISLGEVQVDNNQKIKNKPQVFFQERQVAVVEINGKWNALIGLPIELNPKQVYYANIVQDGKTEKVAIEVRAKKYPQQRLTIKNQRMVEPNAEDIVQINAEKSITAKARYSWDEDPVMSNFSRPINGKIISKYGLQRFFNNQPRAPHSGIDVPAPTGAPVKAVEAGKVILTGKFYFNGNSVFISHGQGVISFYCHLNEIDVMDGELVDKNTIIGKVGATGRVTGPHLHFSLYFNGVAVDPELFFEYEEFKKFN